MEFQFEEFQESEVIFCDNYTSSDRNPNPTFVIMSNSHHSKRNKNHTEQSSSAPVDIPGSNNSSPSSSFRYDNGSQFDEFNNDHHINHDKDYYGYDDRDLVPPHMIVDRRLVDGQIACSVSSDYNLLRVRNSVLRLTGFLES